MWPTVGTFHYTLLVYTQEDSICSGFEYDAADRGALEVQRVVGQPNLEALLSLAP